MKRSRAVALALLLLALPPGEVQARTQRHHDPHVHGTTRVDIALQEGDLLIAVTAPGANMVGFEHPAHDAAERRQLATVLDALRAPAAWLRPAEPAQCKLLDAAAQAPGYEGNGGHADAAGHAHVEARYTYRCAMPGELDHVDIHLSDRYPGTHRVVVEAVLPGRQVRRELCPGEYRVRLAP